MSGIMPSQYAVPVIWKFKSILEKYFETMLFKIQNIAKSILSRSTNTWLSKYFKYKYKILQKYLKYYLNY